MMYDIDIDRLRSDLEDDYGTAMAGGFPMAVMDLVDVEQMTDREVVEFAEKHGVDLRKYIC